jgi:hypothetical protein
MAIRWKRVALFSLLAVFAVPVGACALVVSRIVYDGWQMKRGNYPLEDTSEMTIGMFTIRYERYAVHPYLAEYKRVLTVSTPQRDPQVHELPLDVGGASRMSVCEIADGDTLFVDRFDGHVLHPNGGFQTLVLSRSPENEMSDLALGDPSLPNCMQMLGVFDKDSAGRFRFIPKDE